MKFDFNVTDILRKPITVLSAPLFSQPTHGVEQMEEIINEMGLSSAQVNSFNQQSNHMIFVYKRLLVPVLLTFRLNRLELQLLLGIK